MNRQIFQSMSSWMQLFFLLLFAFFAFFILALFMIVATVRDPQIATSVSFLRISVCLQSILLFLVPSLLCAYLFEKKPLDYLKVNRSINLQTLFLSIIFILSVQPLVSLLGHYNSSLSLPSSMSGLEQQMRLWEDAATKTMEMLLLTDSTTTLLINIFVVAIVAGVTEEVLFRGTLQQLLAKICRNKHLAVWITAFIFSAIHFQFYGFLPRFFLGALLGYLFVWSGNLWIPIIVHTINNAISVLIFHYYYTTPVYDKIENIGAGDTWWTSLISLFLVVFIIYFLMKDYARFQVDTDD